MKITDLEYHLVQIDRISGQPPVRSLLVFIGTDRGVGGWGEMPCQWQPIEVAGRRDAAASILAGRSVYDLEDLHAQPVMPDVSLRAAIEMACLDAVGRGHGLSLCGLLGGIYRQRIPLIVPLARQPEALIADDPAGADSTGDRPAVQLPDMGEARAEQGDDSRSPEDQWSSRALRSARVLCDRGFHHLMVPATGTPEVDVETMLAIGQEHGSRVSLWCDGRRRYTFDQARDVCIELERIGPQLLLDPIATDRLGPVANLQRQVFVPLGVERAVNGPSDILAVVRNSAGRHVGIDPWRAGGLLPTRRCTAVAEAGQLQPLLRCRPSVGVATAALLQLAASLPELSAGIETDYHDLKQDILTAPLETHEGMSTVTETPGLGVDIDRDRLEELTIGC